MGHPSAVLFHQCRHQGAATGVPLSASQASDSWLLEGADRQTIKAPKQSNPEAPNPGPNHSLGALGAAMQPKMIRQTVEAFSKIMNLGQHHRRGGYWMENA